MRTFVSIIVVGVAAGLTGHTADEVEPKGEYCESSCAQTMGCSESYCKDNGVCFGLYHKDDGKCFQPDSEYNADCDDSVLKPVLCHEYPDTTCQEVCDGMAGCKDSSWGSYCKFWQDPPVCFGIITKDDGSLCHASDDDECVGEPYPCHMATVDPTSSPDTTDAFTSEDITTEYTPTTPVGNTTVLEDTTVVKSTTQPVSTDDIIGTWCGDSPFGYLEMIFDTTYVSLYVAGQYFYSQYNVNEREIVLVNPDDNLATFLREMNSQIITEYYAFEMYIEFVEVTTVVAVKCS
ncbi:hypothetical protein FOZ62_001517 [Perkinsus olseni]|uniref:Uncharacterized protein n=1 Tax=Perkinsus olseni TaxID=32597 RepID=A0A7J6RIP2_PEROL|nr:hypothetical protein FOZ62_001517 [Perkinsus olseni]